MCKLYQNPSTMKTVITTLLLCFTFLSNAQDMEPQEIIASLEIKKKNAMVLGAKAGMDYGELKEKLAKNKPSYLNYDEANDLFILNFNSSGDNYAELKFKVQNNQVIGVHCDVYIASTARSHQLMGILTKKLNKTYSGEGEGMWSGAGHLKIEMFDGSSNGFAGFVLDYEPISK